MSLIAINECNLVSIKYLPIFSSIFYKAPKFYKMWAVIIYIVMITQKLLKFYSSKKDW